MMPTPFSVAELTTGVAVRRPTGRVSWTSRSYAGPAPPLVTVMRYNTGAPAATVVG